MPCAFVLESVRIVVRLLKVAFFKRSDLNGPTLNGVTCIQTDSGGEGYLTRSVHLKMRKVNVRSLYKNQD